MTSEKDLVFNNVPYFWKKWKRSKDRGKIFGTLLTNLSKAFDCLNKDPLIVKLSAYGFSLPALRLIYDNLLNGKQRTRINNSYCTWTEFVLGVSQGWIIGPFLFNIFLADFLYTINSMDITDCADSHTPYATANEIYSFIVSLEEYLKSLFT